MIQKYSIVFMPSKVIIAEIKALKLQLAETIGWFNSKNYLAHITICEFEVDDNQSARMATEIINACKYLQSKALVFDHFDCFEKNGAYFIAPNSESEDFLKKAMQTINKKISFKGKKTSSVPHLTIARKLSIENQAVANKLFQEINLSFLCKSVFLCRFDTEKKQYEVLSEFPFTDQFRFENAQQTLF
ncbi:2'-5' RNA ligase family protein [Flavobacterium sp. TAB 87]|uniref:2'-5' RNA ligase family protein n=1 Tax=Flavobacterium sp. TAB 87 TaxID=1729581 RepID=UPI00076DCA8A|nr:2'-5' RNA ligase family protein [Flavobacterium sp. TAB 87]KVV14941.1 2'-5' RNA ligase [Flavobacterium sp. TAB 87]